MGGGPIGSPPGGSSSGLQSVPMQQPPYLREYDRRDDRELDPPGGGIGPGLPVVDQ